MGEAMIERCGCAGLAYRNNINGTRDYKIVGDKRCKICRGSGFIVECLTCMGAGVYHSERCPGCGGYGSKRAEAPAVQGVQA